MAVRTAAAAFWLTLLLAATAPAATLPVPFARTVAEARALTSTAVASALAARTSSLTTDPPAAVPKSLASVDVAPLLAAECLECDGQLDWSGVYDTSNSQCNPDVCCCPCGLAVAFQVGAMVLVSSPVTGRGCGGLDVVFFGVMSNNSSAIAIEVLDNPILVVRTNSGDVSLTSINQPTCTGIARRVADATIADPDTAAETVPVLIVWLAFGMAGVALLAWVGVLVYSGVAVLVRRRSPESVHDDEDGGKNRPLLSAN